MLDLVDLTVSFNSSLAQDTRGCDGRVKCDYTCNSHKPLYFPAHEELHHICSVHHHSYCSWVLASCVDLAF